VPEKVWREILARRGQEKFREGLLRAYGGRCCLSDCDVPEALEAAHIERHADSALQDVTNGLLLRADLHTLFDLGLLRVRPDTLKAALAPALAGSCYRAFEGKAVREPGDEGARPSRQKLRERWERDEARLKGREGPA
jgi:hypothetical protein